MNKQRRVLVVLLLLLIPALFYGYWKTPRQQRVGDAKTVTAVTRPASKPAGSTRGGKAAPATEAWPRLRSELLERRKEPYPGVRHDLFHGAGRMSTVVTPEPEPQPAPVPEPVVDTPPPVVIAPPPPPPPTPQELAARELARFTFLGFLKKATSQTIFLAREGEIFLVHKGDRFGKAKEFLVTRLTDRELAIRQATLTEEIVIPLIDQAPLTPASPGGLRTESAAVTAPEPAVEEIVEPPAIQPEPEPPPQQAESLPPDVEQRRREMERRQQEQLRRRDIRSGNPFTPAARRAIPQPQNGMDSQANEESDEHQ